MGKCERLSPVWSTDLGLKNFFSFRLKKSDQDLCEWLNSFAEEREKSRVIRLALREYFLAHVKGAGGIAPPAVEGGFKRPAGMARVEVARIDTKGMVLEVKNEELQAEENPEELFKRLDECFR